MAQPTDHLVDQIAQLNAARNLVLGDAAFYPQIVTGILPLVGANSRLELRRWGADFLAETFASPALATAQKEQLAANVLQTIREILEVPESDMVVLRSLVQTAASLYPLIFRHIINHPEDKDSWEKMTAIKQDILRKWDSFPFPVKVCCIKFVQRVVQVQSHGLISDPRRPEQNETSLAIVPRNHAILSLPNLEAEASGLLDRLLTIFQEDSSDPLLVNATLNCLPGLVRSRQSIANKIINTILNFFPAHQAQPPITASTRVKIKSMERTARALAINIMKKNPNHPLTGRLQQYAERLMQSRLDIVDEEASRKRGLPAEPTDGLDNAKRARLDAETPPLMKIPPLPPGRLSYAQLYTLTEDAGLSSFDVKQLPPDLVVKIAIPILARIDQSSLNQAIDAMRIRYQTYSKQQAAQPQSPEEEDDDYEPEYQPMDTLDKTTEQADAIAEAAAEPELLGPFVLPKPPPLTQEEARSLGCDAAGRIFDLMAAADPTPKQSSGKSQLQRGFARLAGGGSDREYWAILLIRIATRAPTPLGEKDEDIDADSQNGSAESAKPNIANSIRNRLFRYILEDFRSRIPIGITWLTEEWYSGRIAIRSASDKLSDPRPPSPAMYEKWCLRLLDGIIPYLDSRDTRLFIRFASEIPEITTSITSRMSSIAKDPERVNLCVQSLLYLIMYRPPAREMCLDTLENVYETYEESRPAAIKILSKWRPEKYKKPQQPEPATIPSNPPTTQRESDSPSSIANGTDTSSYQPQSLPQHIRPHETPESSTPTNA